MVALALLETQGMTLRNLGESCGSATAELDPLTTGGSGETKPAAGHRRTGARHVAHFVSTPLFPTRIMPNQLLALIFVVAIVVAVAVMLLA
jgi:hypothetical protein